MCFGRVFVLFAIIQVVLEHHAQAAVARQLSDGHGSFFPDPSDVDVLKVHSGLSESEQACSDTKSCRKEAFGNVTYSINPSRGCVLSVGDLGVQIATSCTIIWCSSTVGLFQGVVAGVSWKETGVMRLCTSTGMLGQERGQISSLQDAHHWYALCSLL
jgi:hypothetical protein